MTARQKSLAVDLIKWAALFASLVVGVWKVDEHFVTRQEFMLLRQDVSAIRQSLEGIHHATP